MERNYRTIIEQHLRKLNAEVMMAAFSRVAPGVIVTGLKPNFYKLAYVAKGEGWLEMNGARYVTRAGHMALLPAGFEQNYGIVGTEPCELYWCNFEANLGEAELISSLKLPLCVDMAGRDDILRLFQVMVASYNDSKLTSLLRVKAALYEAIAAYLEECRIDEEAFARIEVYVKLADVLAYIDEHLSDNMTLEDLARIAYLHPNYFISLFKNMIGYSPIQYVNMQRLEAAKKLLAETDINVADIANSVGMQNHYLSRLFKQHTGISPTRYRQLYRDSHRCASEASAAAEALHVGGRKAGGTR